MRQCSLFSKFRPYFPLSCLSKTRPVHGEFVILPENQAFLLLAQITHPFAERLVDTIRREYLEKTLLWNKRDLEEMLGEFQAYYNAHRVDQALKLSAPDEAAGKYSPHLGI
tara:strand:+ start:100 stop:432 length:333 start_codon:yes stop_codon:yes gene_type:complete